MMNMNTVNFDVKKIYESEISASDFGIQLSMIGWADGVHITLDHTTGYKALGIELDVKKATKLRDSISEWLNSVDALTNQITKGE